MNAVTLQSVDVIMTVQTHRQVSTVLVIPDTNLCLINGLVMILMSAMKLHQYVARFVRTQLAPTSVSVPQAISGSLTEKVAGKIVISPHTLFLATVTI